MGGICGVAGLEDRGLVARMSEPLRPRGPNLGSLFQGRGVLLGDRRLRLILRRAVGPLLPRETVERRKQGFVVPTPPWARGELGDRIAQVLSEASSGIFRRRMFVDSDGTKPRDFDAHLR